MIANAIQGDDGNELNRYLDALASFRRRHALYYLDDQAACNVSELAEYVRSCETGRPPSEITEDECRPVRIDLYHNHLPHLANDCLVSFDERSEDIRMESPPMTFRGLLWICHLFENPP